MFFIFLTGANIQKILNIIVNQNNLYLSEVDKMNRIILTADHSLMTEFRNIALFGFFSCSPVQYVPEILYDRLFAPLVPSDNGRARFAQYGLRKVEATLAKGFKDYEVVTVHPHYLDRFFNGASVVGLTVMDPLGIGPVTSSFAFGSNLTPYNRKKFLDLLNSIKGKDCRIVVGGSCAWQLAEREDLPIDHILIGEFERDGVAVFEEILNGTDTRVFYLRKPDPDEITSIMNPSINGLVEISRGCPRKCSYCEVASRKRDIPIGQIKKEVRINAEAGHSFAWLHAEDVLLYGCNSRKLEPDVDEVIELFKEVLRAKGVKSAGTTHFSLSAVAATPELIEKLSEITGKGWHGVQPGIETGSPKLMKKYMKNKVKPFRADEWPDVVVYAIEILNKYHWFPACTLLVGLPEETEEDVEMTIRLVEKLDRYHCILAPLFYVPLGALRNVGSMFSMKKATPTHCRLIYECWRHNLKEFSQGIWRATSDMNPLLRLICSFLVKVGSREILSNLRNILSRNENLAS